MERRYGQLHLSQLFSECILRCSPEARTNIYTPLTICDFIYYLKWDQFLIHLFFSLPSLDSSYNDRKIHCSVVSDSLRPRGLQPTRLLRPWDSPGKNTGVGCHFLLQGIFPIQGLNLGLPHCRQTLYHLSHQGIQVYL